MRKKMQSDLQYIRGRNVANDLSTITSATTANPKN